MKLTCKFEIFIFPKDGEFYQCKIIKNDQEIPQNEEFEFIGQHLPGKSDSDVTFVEFCDSNCPKVPQGLTKTFPNLKGLGIYNSKLEELSKDDLVEYKNIEKFICNKNPVDFLPGDLFEGFEKLKHINFYDNKFGIIEPNLLDSFDDLDYVTFIGNPQYGTSYDKNAYYLKSTTFNDVKNHLFEKFFHLKFENFNKFIKKYPDPDKILKFYGQKASNYCTSIGAFDQKYKIYDDLRPKEVEEIKNAESKLIGKCEELENSNLKLEEKLNNLKESKSELEEQIEKLKVELKNEKQETSKLKKNLQKQIDKLAEKLQSVMLVNV